jgi:hypothetical protein
MSARSPNADYLGIITPQEIQQLRAAKQAGRVHPVAALALGDPKQQVAYNTEQAAEQIAAADESWLLAMKPRLMDTTKFSQASSALGELRAYGYLLETGMTVRPEPTVPGKKVVPEFEVDADDGPVIVEVHSRQIDGQQAQAITQHHNGLAAKHEEAVQQAPAGQAVVTFAELHVMPFGAPEPAKQGDSILTNAISRISSIKQDEDQIDPAKPFVLWLDLQDPTVWNLPISEEQLAPLYTEVKFGLVRSGALWFALYGRKGEPMIESASLDYRFPQMLHDGRFFQIMKSHGALTRISAVVYSLPEATVLMENPEPSRPLPPNFRASVLKAPFFKLDRSICEWSTGVVSARMNAEKNAIASAAKALETFNLP